MASRRSTALVLAGGSTSLLASPNLEIARRSFPGDRARMLRQVMAARRGRRTFGFFSSLGKAIGGIAKTSLSIASNVAQIGFRATPLGQALSITGAIAPSPFDPGFAQPFRGGARPLPLSTQLATGAPVTQFSSPVPPQGCPPGFINVKGRCEQQGLRGSIERFLPGGQTGLLVDEAGQAVMGAFGVPAEVPMQVGTISRRDGTVGPVLRCRRGMVLGIDELCYVKSTIDKKNRKWVPARKPPISAADWRAAMSIKRVQKGVKRVASASGLSCSRR